MSGLWPSFPLRCRVCHAVLISQGWPCSKCQQEVHSHCRCDCGGACLQCCLECGGGEPKTQVRAAAQTRSGSLLLTKPREARRRTRPGGPSTRNPPHTAWWYATGRTFRGLLIRCRGIQLWGSLVCQRRRNGLSGILRTQPHGTPFSVSSTTKEAEAYVAAEGGQTQAVIGANTRAWERTNVRRNNSAQDLTPQTAENAIGESVRTRAEAQQGGLRTGPSVVAGRMAYGCQNYRIHDQHPYGTVGG